MKFKTRRRLTTLLAFCAVFVFIFYLGGGFKRKQSTFLQDLDWITDRPARKEELEWAYLDVLVQNWKVTRNQIREIPKTFYTYWHHDTVPEFIRDCTGTWLKHNPEWQLRILTRSALNKSLKAPVPSNFDTISRPYQADWVKLAILAQEGGVWVDASFIMTDSIDSVLQIQQDEQTEGMQFFMDYFTSDVSYPYFENWFIAAVPQADYILHWFLEWSYCVLIHQASDSYLNHLELDFGELVYNQLVQASDSPSYLKQHVSLQKVLRLDNIKGPSGLSALKPPLGPLWMLDQHEWNTWEFVDSLIDLWKASDPVPAFLKLRSFERDAFQLQLVQGFEWLWEWGLWQPGRKRFWQVNRGSFYCIFILGEERGCGGRGRDLGWGEIAQ
ncbi:hypothetical protein HDV03_000645 [Kappamyces sp. JEL0829]|nr:hypothetical protein HDV03_000645 [Kappamyces sp. JEL0829]